MQPPLKPLHPISSLSPVKLALIERLQTEQMRFREKSSTGLVSRMFTDLYWVDGPWPGRLALAARPRGGDWLPDEMAAWHKAGIDVVASLLTSEEERTLDLQAERKTVAGEGMEFVSLPIEDRGVPSSEAKVGATVERLDRALSSGKNAVIHCRQGVGRTGLMAASLLISKGISVESAIGALSAARGTAVPETPEQRRWIDHYAAIAA